jgi:hypothetical protein
MSDIDYGARARLDYIEKQLQALFPDSYIPFERAESTGLPAAVVELARAGNLIAAIKETAGSAASIWLTRRRPSKPFAEPSRRRLRLQQITVGRRARLDGLDLHLGGPHPL